MEAALLESRTLREGMAERVEVLDKVKALAALPDGIYATTQMVADYFEVPQSTLYAVVADHRAELVANGYRVLEGEALTCFKQVSGIRGRYRSLALFSRRAVLNVAMLLRDSEVARSVRRYLLDAEARPRGCYLEYEDRFRHIERLVLADRALVLARYAARRMNVSADDFAAQLVAHVCVGAANAAYEEWLRDETADLVELVHRAFSLAQRLPELDQTSDPAPKHRTPIRVRRVGR